MKGYPKSYPRLLYLTMFTLAISGLFLVPTFIDLYLEMDMPWRASSDQRLWIAGTHTAAGIFFMMLFGALWAIHMRAGWRRKRHLISGFALSGTALLLTLSCLEIFYSGNEDLSWWSSTTHVALGMFGIPAFAAHRLVAQRRPRRRQHKPARWTNAAASLQEQ